MHRNKLPEQTRHYWSFKYELSLCKNLILSDTAIVKPKSMRNEMFARLHFTYCGINKTVLKAKGGIFWAGIYHHFIYLSQQYNPFCSQYSKQFLHNIRLK